VYESLIVLDVMAAEAAAAAAAAATQSGRRLAATEMNQWSGLFTHSVLCSESLAKTQTILLYLP
jgi:hypothetical protein